jgi:hypothetical protein
MRSSEQIKRHAFVNHRPKFEGFIKVEARRRALTRRAASPK